jgi:hypothetical protein
MNRTTILGLVASAVSFACCIDVARSELIVPERKNPPRRVTPRDMRAAFDWAWALHEVHEASNYLASVGRVWSQEFTVELLNTNGPVRDPWFKAPHVGSREYMVLTIDGKRCVPTWDVTPWGRYGSIWEEE